MTNVEKLKGKSEHKGTVLMLLYLKHADYQDKQCLLHRLGKGMVLQFVIKYNFGPYMFP